MEKTIKEITYNTESAILLAYSKNPAGLPNQAFYVTDERQFFVETSMPRYRDIDTVSEQYAVLMIRARIKNLVLVYDNIARYLPQVYVNIADCK